ncbi:UDP-N-acetylmuramate--alanine ligase [Anaerosporomusa subterranea]|uniref:UDP-N-acetylmuramate--L-alanine ligase n=1 Tax=Anaerosporomusa subterranea TaxID=1794912 RepID=A0A154BT09_ANASB|nr:UDP-N-acetylmuramate--L-alanine ligase [Anaerosporomusa subterranea]KYZ77106.1 UDP-N-acetylmuramate--alanine ligase [Anaerosporomusa subterranea]
MLQTMRKIHFIGIGGAGMSAIAKVLLEMGYQVTGSDLVKSESTRKLECLGAVVFAGHDRDHLDDAEAAIVSTAIPSANPELIAAREKGIPVFHRADMVAALMEDRFGIAVAGAHGKTTTTSMISLVLEHGKLDPTIIIGGELEAIGGNSKLGKSQFVVAEADESDGSFIKLAPKIAVVTNIENDHMDYYGTMENILTAFRDFLHKLPTDGLAIVCFDNSYIRDMADGLGRPFISYAIDASADYTAKNITSEGLRTSFDVFHHETYLGTVTTQVPGRHNVANALAAIIVGLTLGLTLEEASKGLDVFSGVKRRFETKGRQAGVWVVDDYAHHPTEIATTLQAAKGTKPGRLICVFQPHRYTRTQLLKKEFGAAFSAADLLILTDVYSAGEAPIQGVNGETLKQEVDRQTQQQVVYIESKDAIALYLAGVVKPGDMVITMGAGNVYTVGEELVKRLTDK